LQYRNIRNSRTRCPAVALLRRRAVVLRRASADTRTRLVDFYYHVGEARGTRRQHQHDGHQISVTVGGTADMLWWTASSGEARLKPRDGHILVNPAGELHATEWQGSWDCVGFYIDKGHTAAIAADLGITHAVAPVYDGTDRAVHGLARGLLQEADTDPLTCRLYAENLADFLALRLLRGVPARRQPAVPGLTALQLRRVSDYIAAHLDEDISSVELAGLVELSAFHFARRFKASTGMAPYQYVMRQRIELARELLARTRLSISEISFRAGFSSQSHLGARFRQIVGMTPRRYREHA
jgi:AraC family transcriptional regulator